MTHDDIDLGDYAQGRLTSPARDRARAHVDVCVECREWLSTYRYLRSRLGDAGEIDHPSADVLAAWIARGLPPASEESRGVERHLAQCPECGADAAVGRDALLAAAPAAGTRLWGPAHLRIAAGIVLTVAGTAALMYGVRASRELEAIRQWSGAIGYVLVEEVTRGRDMPRLLVRPGQPFGLLAMRLDPASVTPEADTIEIDLLDMRGESVWGTAVPASNLTADLRTYGAAFLPIPVHLLSPGTFELRATAVTAGQTAPLLQRQFLVEFVRAP